MLTTKLLFATAAAAYDDEMFSRHPHFEVHAAAAAARKHWRSEKHVFCSHTHTRARAVGRLTHTGGKGEHKSDHIEEKNSKERPRIHHSSVLLCVRTHALLPLVEVGIAHIHAYLSLRACVRVCSDLK